MQANSILQMILVSMDFIKLDFGTDNVEMKKSDQWKGILEIKKKRKDFKWKYFEEEKGNGRTWQQCEKNYFIKPRDVKKLSNFFLVSFEWTPNKFRKQRLKFEISSVITFSENSNCFSFYWFKNEQ